MKKIPFYILTNKLYIMSFRNYLNHIKSTISQNWFKKACKEKKIKVIFLSKDIFFDNQKNCYLRFIKNKLYFYKYFLLKFEYEELENNNHLKLLNINIKNETVFKVSSLIFSIQKSFLDTKHYQDIDLITRKEFIDEYTNRYNTYLDSSILSKILNNINYSYKNSKFKLNSLILKKNFIYSLYIKDLLNSDLYQLKNDYQISQILLQFFEIKLSRRTVCTIRNKYLILRVQKRKKFNFYFHNEKFYDEKRELNKYNISLLEKKLSGIYELSTNTLKKYYFSKNSIIYIGSSKNIKKRLATYTLKTAHSKDIKNFMQTDETIYFRIIRTLNYKEFEMQLINSFIDINGELPKLNKQRILKINFLDK